MFIWPRIKLNTISIIIHLIYIIDVTEVIVMLLNVTLPSILRQTDRYTDKMIYECHFCVGS